MTEHSRNKIHLPKLTLEKTAQCGVGKDTQSSSCSAVDGPLVPIPLQSASCSLSYFNKALNQALSKGPSRPATLP